MKTALIDTILRAKPELMHALRVLRDCIPHAYIGAGTVRSAVWDHLHGYTVATRVPDIDVVHFSLDALETDADLRQRLLLRAPGLAWEVTNQATVHLWYERCFGVPAAPCTSIDEAIATWPETATAVAVRLLPDASFDLIAPFGMADLMDMVVRWNPARATYAHYLARIEQKQYQRTWPRVRVFYADCGSKASA